MFGGGWVVMIRLGHTNLSVHGFVLDTTFWYMLARWII